MNMIESVKKVLRNYATFSGRADRPEYWWFVLFVMIIVYGIGFIAAAIGIPILGSILSLALIVPSIAVGVRRMHDVGKSGWYLLIPIYSIILTCTEGQPGQNEYGPDPKAGTSTFDVEENRLNS